jgi:hypothetical protein
VSYYDLSDEDKLEAAIRFVALDQPLPKALVDFLHEAGLYEVIVNPEGFDVYDTGGDEAANQPTATG